MYSEMSPPLYTEDLPALHMSGPSYVLQIGPYYEDLDGEYQGGGVAEEEGEGREIEIENKGWDVSIEL